MADITEVHPLDLRSLIADEIDIIHHNDDTYEIPAGSGKLYRLSVDVPVTSAWGKEVLEAAKYVNLHEE